MDWTCCRRFIRWMNYRCILSGGIFAEAAPYPERLFRALAARGPLSFAKKVAFPYLNRSPVLSFAIAGAGSGQFASETP